MATPTEAIAAISATTGVAEDAVGRLARALRQAEGDLWPRSQKGGGKGAVHVQPPHLINLALAQGVGAEPAHAAARTRTYRLLLIFQAAGSGQGLTRSSKHSRKTLAFDTAVAEERSRSFSNAVGRLLDGREVYDDDRLRPGENLGEDLEILVHSMGTNPMMREQLRPLLTVQVMRHTPEANIRFALQQGEQINTYASNSALQEPAQQDVPGRISVQATLPYALLETLAELWADTLKVAPPHEQREQPIDSYGAKHEVELIQQLQKILKDEED
ncbi:hypothetical protein ACFQS7_27910 [Dankookia sp. GCM10030260]|uniref:hypothetical protein n=1 Tax=Dankookia sp. GCM10030260 TaxID=3273390 RepID=UPI0036226E13